MIMSYIDKRNEIDSLQQKINSYGELSAEVKKKINYKFRLDWNYYSNSMEGNTLTMDETRSVMVGNLTVGGKPIKDVLEMKGHDEVIAEILKIGKGETRLSEARIREIHKGIMHEEDEAKKKKIGGWKTAPNHVINYKGEKFEFALPGDVPERMHELLNNTNAAIDAIQQKKKPASSADRDVPHPVDIALQFHLDYVLIHPFYDGNGRTARILTNLLLISFGYPPFWVKTNERNIYNQYIADIQGYGGKADLFFDFAAGLILRSQQLILDAIEGKDIEEENDLDKEIILFKKSLNRTNESNKLKSEQDMKLILEDSGIKLFNKLIEKLSGFNDLFHKSVKRLIYSDSEEISYNIKTRSGGKLLLINKQFPESFLDWLSKNENKNFFEFGI
jgi:Fic family protein